MRCKHLSFLFILLKKYEVLVLLHISKISTFQFTLNQIKSFIHSFSVFLSTFNVYKFFSIKNYVVIKKLLRPKKKHLKIFSLAVVFSQTSEYPAFMHNVNANIRNKQMSMSTYLKILKYLKRKKYHNFIICNCCILHHRVFILE